MKKRVLLINPPLYFSGGKPESLDVTVPPLGLLYLAAYINKNLEGFSASVIDVAAENYSLEELKLKIARIKPFVIGITSMTAQLQGAVDLTEFIKRNFDDIKIFLGGPHVSADPDFLRRFGRIFDYAITGESELTLAKSVVKLSQKKKIPKLQKGEAVLDLDSLPFPDRNLIKKATYSRYASMIFSRGCPYNCYYCSRPGVGKKVRYRSSGNLIREIKSVFKSGQGKIDFQDDTFTLRRKPVLEFCQRVEKEGLKLSWRCNTRIDLVDEELLTAMKKAGCELIHFGIEAGNEKVRREIVKKGHFSNKDVYKVTALCKKYGIEVAGYFMIGHPGETKREIAQTEKMIFSSGIDLLGLSIPTPFPGSELYRLAEKAGIISKELIDQYARKELGEGYAGVYPFFVSEKVSREYVFSQMREINRKFYLNFATFRKRLWQDFTSVSRLKSDFFDFWALVLRGISTRKPYISN